MTEEFVKQLAQIAAENDLDFEFNASEQTINFSHPLSYLMNNQNADIIQEFVTGTTASVVK